MQGPLFWAMTSCTFWGKMLDLRFYRMVYKWRYIWIKQFIHARQGHSFLIFLSQPDTQYLKIKQKNMLLPRDLCNHLAHYSHDYCCPLLKKFKHNFIHRNQAWKATSWNKAQAFKSRLSSGNYPLLFLSPALTGWIFTCSGEEIQY